MANDLEVVLKEPINNLQFSNEFKAFAHSHHFNTVAELLEEKVSLLLKKPGFNFHMLQELIQFLEQRNMTNLLQY